MHSEGALDVRYLGTFDIFHGRPVIGGTGNLSFREKSKFSVSIGEEESVHLFSCLSFQQTGAYCASCVGGTAIYLAHHHCWRHARRMSGLSQELLDMIRTGLESTTQASLFKTRRTVLHLLPRLRQSSLPANELKLTKPALSGPVTLLYILTTDVIEQELPSGLASTTWRVYSPFYLRTAHLWPTC